MSGQSGDRLTAAEQLGEYLDQFCKVAAEIADITSPNAAKHHHGYWERAARIPEFKPEPELGAYSAESPEQRKQILVWDEYGPVARLDATVFHTGIVLLRRLDAGYMAVRLVDRENQPVGQPMLKEGDEVQGRLGPEVTNPDEEVTNPDDLLDFLELAFRQDDLDD